MSIEKQLLFSVLSAPIEERGNLLSRLIDAGVTANMFANDEEHRAFEYILEYRMRYGVCPSIPLVEVETGIRFPNYVSQQPFEFWFDEFRKYVKHGIMLEMLALVEQNLEEGEVDRAVRCIGNVYAGLTDLMHEHRSAATLAELAGPILEKHDRLQRGLLHEGIYTGFPYIDNVTGGAQPGDTWVIAGESGSGKTFILVRCAMSAVEAGKKCLFVSMEMPNMQLGRRTMAMGSEVNATSLRLGRLSRFGVEHVRDFIRSWGPEQNERLKFIEGRINYSVNDVKAKIKEFKPDAVFVDGAYMLRSGQFGRARWEMNMEVMEALKQFAMSENIAIISTFQFDQKQKMKNLSTIMGGQAIGQLASIVIGIENEDTQSNFNGVQFKELTLYKGREGETGKIRLRYDMNRTRIVQDSIIEGTITDENVPEHEFDSLDTF